MIGLGSNKNRLIDLMTVSDNEDFLHLVLGSFCLLFCLRPQEQANIFCNASVRRVQNVLFVQCTTDTVKSTIITRSAAREVVSKLSSISTIITISRSLIIIENLNRNDLTYSICLDTITIISTIVSTITIISSIKICTICLDTTITMIMIISTSTTIMIIFKIFTGTTCPAPSASTSSPTLTTLSLATPLRTR